MARFENMMREMAESQGLRLVKATSGFALDRMGHSPREAFGYKDGLPAASPGAILYLLMFGYDDALRKFSSCEIFGVSLYRFEGEAFNCWVERMASAEGRDLLVGRTRLKWMKR